MADQEPLDTIREMISILWELHDAILLLNPRLSAEDVQREQSIHGLETDLLIIRALLNG